MRHECNNWCICLQCCNNEICAQHLCCFVRDNEDDRVIVQDCPNFNNKNTAWVSQWSNGNIRVDSRRID